MYIFFLNSDKCKTLLQQLQAYRLGHRPESYSLEPLLVKITTLLITTISTFFNHSFINTIS